MIELWRRALKKIGLEVRRIPAPIASRRGINLNVGSGKYVIDGFVSLDHPSSHYYPKGMKERIPYDMRNDSIPFASQVANAVYCSHVIEHIETRYVVRFFEEALRVLKPGGFLRVVCPDAKFLHDQTVEFPGYWAWHPLFRRDGAWRCFVDEVSSKSGLVNFGLEREPQDYSYDEILQELSKDEEFSELQPSRHINWFDFERLLQIGRGAGFSKIILSRFQGSSCAAFQGRDMDLTHPEMSLYVDFQR